MRRRRHAGDRATTSRPRRPAYVTSRSNASAAACWRSRSDVTSAQTRVCNLTLERVGGGMLAIAQRRHVRADPRRNLTLERVGGGMLAIAQRRHVRADPRRNLTLERVGGGVLAIAQRRHVRADPRRNLTLERVGGGMLAIAQCFMRVSESAGGGMGQGQRKNHTRGGHSPVFRNAFLFSTNGRQLLHPWPSTRLDPPSGTQQRNPNDGGNGCRSASSERRTACSLALRVLSIQTEATWGITVPG